MSTPHPYLHFHARTPNPRSTPPLLQLYLTVPPPLGTATIVTTGHRLCVGPPRHQPMPRQAPASLDAALSPCTTGCHHNNADRAPPPRVASSPRATTVHHATLLMSDPFSLSLCVCVCVQEGRAAADRGHAAVVGPRAAATDSERRWLLQASSLPPPMASATWIHALSVVVSDGGCYGQ
jgi:hypothetical protein